MNQYQQAIQTGLEGGRKGLESIMLISDIVSKLRVILEKECNDFREALRSQGFLENERFDKFASSLSFSEKTISYGVTLAKNGLTLNLEIKISSVGIKVLDPWKLQIFLRKTSIAEDSDPQLYNLESRNGLKEAQLLEVIFGNIVEMLRPNINVLVSGLRIKFIAYLEKHIVENTIKATS